MPACRAPWRDDRAVNAVRVFGRLLDASARGSALRAPGSTSWVSNAKSSVRQLPLRERRPLHFGRHVILPASVWLGPCRDARVDWFEVGHEAAPLSTFVRECSKHPSHATRAASWATESSPYSFNTRAWACRREPYRARCQPLVRRLPPHPRGTRRGKAAAATLADRE